MVLRCTGTPTTAEEYQDAIAKVLTSLLGDTADAPEFPESS